MSKNDNKHLIQRGNVWWYQRKVPVKLKHLFNNKSIHRESLQTGDIRAARAKREVINGKFSSLVIREPSNHKAVFRDYVDKFQRAKEESFDYWDANLDGEALERKGEYIIADALRTVGGAKDMSFKYQTTLLDGVDVWIERVGHLKSKDNQQRTIRIANEFLSVIDEVDINLSDLTRQMAFKYLQFLEAQGYSKATLQGYMSRLKMVWKINYDCGNVEGNNPFEGHTYNHGKKTVKTPIFKRETLLDIIDLAKNEPQKNQLIFKICLLTGCRPKEICSLKSKYLELHSEHWIFQIVEGKNESAKRRIPVPKVLLDEALNLKQLKEDNELLIGISEKECSRWFSTLKSNLPYTTDAKFYSARALFATMCERSAIKEGLASALMGHKNAQSLTYGYYSKGQEAQVLSEVLETVIEKLINDYEIPISWLKSY